jgi:hypothetical protein
MGSEPVLVKVKFSLEVSAAACPRPNVDGREKFAWCSSLVRIGSVRTLETPSDGPAPDEASGSDSATRAARFEGGTRSPFRRLPLR